MPFMMFLLLLLTTFPYFYWFPPVAFFFIAVGSVWMVCYPIACTAHMLYMRVRYGKWVAWHLLYPSESA